MIIRIKENAQSKYNEMVSLLDAVSNIASLKGSKSYDYISDLSGDIFLRLESQGVRDLINDLNKAKWIINVMIGASSVVTRSMNESVSKEGVKAEHFGNAHYTKSWVNETLEELRRNDISPNRALSDLETRIEQLYAGIKYNEELIVWVEQKIEELKDTYDVSKKEGQYVLGNKQGIGGKTIYVTATAFHQHNPMVYQSYDIDKAKVFTYDKALEAVAYCKKYVTGAGPFNVIEKPLKENVSLAPDPQKSKKQLDKRNKRASLLSGPGMRKNLASIRTNSEGTALTSDGKVNQGVLPSGYKGSTVASSSGQSFKGVPGSGSMGGTGGNA